MEKNKAPKRRVIPLPKATADSPDFIMQDLDTGEVQPADDLAKMIFGSKVDPKEVRFEEIEGKE